MATDKQLRNAHAKEYIREVFADHLIRAGFQCPDDRLLCWYRAKNTDVINSIIFYSQYPKLPLSLWIGYGIFPSFQKPFYLRNVVCNDYPWNEEHFCDQPIIENVPYGEMQYRPYSSDIMVYAPSQHDRGIYTFDGVLLPAMNSIDTLNDVYYYHKSRYKNKPYAKDIGAYKEISRTFIAMAYLVEDIELYPDCQKRISNAIELYQKLHFQFPKRKKYEEELNGWKELETAFRVENRPAFLGVLETRKEQNLYYLKEKLKIHPV